MPDYKQSAVSGDRWNRMRRLIIEYPRQGLPSILCVEQEVISLGAGLGDVERDVGNLSFTFDPLADFPILDPETLEVRTLEWLNTLPLGMRTLVLTFSYTLAEAKKRDERSAS